MTPQDVIVDVWGLDVSENHLTLKTSTSWTESFSSEETSTSRGSKHGIELLRDHRLPSHSSKDATGRKSTKRRHGYRLCKISGCASKVKFRVCRVSFPWSFCIWPVIKPGRRPRRKDSSPTYRGAMNCWLAMCGSEFESSLRFGPPPAWSHQEETDE